MSRLETWIAQEVALHEHHYGRLHDDERERFRATLEKTLRGQQLRCADAFGDAGDVVLRALKEHSGRARDWSLREWFRRHW